MAVGKYVVYQLERSKYVNKKCKKKTILGLNFKKILCILTSEPEYKKPFPERLFFLHEITENFC